METEAKEAPATKVQIKAPEGWSYHGYQRVAVYLCKEEGGVCKSVNLTKPIVEIWNYLWLVDNATPADPSELLHLSADGLSAFVLSGESFTLEDFSEIISPVLPMGYEVELFEGVK